MTRQYRLIQRASTLLLCGAWMMPAGHVCAQEAVADPSFSEDGTSLAARVGGEEIPLVDFDLAVNQYVMSQRLGPDSDVTIEEIQHVVLDRLVLTLLASQRARELGVAATEEEVEAQLAALRAEVGSPDDFRLFLTVQNMDEAKLRKQIERQISAERVVQVEVLDKVKVEESEVQAYYTAHKQQMIGPEKAKVRHIFVRLPAGASDEERDAARAKIDRLKQRLDAGEEFADLAVEASEDGAAANGGELGWIARGEVSGPFELVAFSVPVDKISEVVATDYGYHIIQVEDRQEAGVVSLEEARPKIEYQLREDKNRVAVRKYLADLRSNGDVQTFLPGDDSGSREQAVDDDD